MKAVPIGKVVESIEKWNPRVTGLGEINYIDISCVDHHTQSILQAKTILASEAPTRARQLVAGGDVILSTVNPRLNTAAYVDSRFEGATVSTGFCVLRPRVDAIHGRYLYHWVTNTSFVDYLVRFERGAIFPAVSDKDVKSAPIPLPPMEEQRRIAAVLDAADSLRVKPREALSKLDDLMVSVYYSRFSDCGSGNAWPTTTLGEVCEFKYGKSLPRSKRSGHGFGVYGSNGEVGRHHDPLTDGTTIVVGRKGSFGEVAYSEDSCWPIDTAYYVDRSATGADLRWLYHCLKSLPLKDLNRAAAVPGLNRQDAYAQTLALPSIEAQRGFGELFDEVEAMRTRYLDGLDLFDSLFTSLQQRAFRGEL